MKKIIWILLAALITGVAGAAEREVKIIAYNVLIGFNHGQKVDETAAWLTEQAPEVILFQEIARQDSESFAQLAKKWGHQYAAVAKPYTDYSIALSSRYPFELLETRTVGMHHGYVLAKIRGVYFMSIHLSPFKYKVRIKETEIYVKRLKPLIDAGEKVIVMGDFNNPSPYDTQVNSNEKLLAHRRESDAKHDHIENLNNGFFDFTCTQNLLDAGLEEICYFWMKANRVTPRVGNRIDQAYISKNLLPRVTSAYVDTTQYDFFRTLSDHFPVILTFSELFEEEVK